MYMYVHVHVYAVIGIQCCTCTYAAIGGRYGDRVVALFTIYGSGAVWLMKLRGRVVDRVVRSINRVVYLVCMLDRGRNAANTL